MFRNDPHPVLETTFEKVLFFSTALLSLSFWLSLFFPIITSLIIGFSLSTLGFAFITRRSIREGVFSIFDKIAEFFGYPTPPPYDAFEHQRRELNYVRDVRNNIRAGLFTIEDAREIFTNRFYIYPAIYHDALDLLDENHPAPRPVPTVNPQFQQNNNPVHSPLEQKWNTFNRYDGYVFIKKKSHNDHVESKDNHMDKIHHKMG